jgi:predicted CXXCH cytochrome family protein
VTRKRRKTSGQGKPAKAPTPAPPHVSSPDARSGMASNAKIWIAALAVAVAVAIVAIGIFSGRFGPGITPQQTVDASTPPPGFVGSDVCIGCHRQQGELWHGSQHAHAMDHASEASVLGDFNDASFEHFGVRSRFFRQGGKFMVETDGPDGKLATFEVKYTFGISPLQQYLVAFPDGRIQALPLAWDSRPKEEGGQHWFHLYPNEAIGHDDVLHWTKLNQNWNFMCAECHSTGVHKNYDADKDRFATSWAEINVGCEACHGQGSAHVAWARTKQDGLPGTGDDSAKGLLARFDERSGVTWGHDPVSNAPKRSAAPMILHKEVEMCGRCHARRGQISEDWVPGHPLSDTHLVAELSEGLYQADGQMRDEVYNYGSFKQSKMFAAGVTCSDCHDPHSAKLKSSGNDVCLQCHASSYAEAAHHHHQGVSPALTCASCHMPLRSYMVVDRRHDHSFRVPRPDLSPGLGTNNACNDCHTDKTPDWAAAAIAGWYGPNRKGFQTYGEAFHKAWTDQPDAARLLAAVAGDANVPAFARASALSELASYLSASTLELARKGLADADPMVRLGALDMLEAIPPAQLWPVISSLLSDPSRAVRIKVASMLAGLPVDSLSATDREQLERATQEFLAAQRLNADRPEARTTLANFYARGGNSADAEREYLAALRLSSAYAPAAANLADLYRQLGRDNEAEAILRKSLEASPKDSGLHHALGLALVRLKRAEEAIEELRRATEFDPGNARYAYVYAVALDSTGHRPDAIAVLKANAARHPNDRDTLSALISFSREQGDTAAALDYAERLAEIVPNDPSLAQLIQDLRSAIAKGQ